MADLSDKSVLRLRLGAALGGLLILSTGVWNVAVYYSGLDQMRNDLAGVRVDVKAINEFMSKKVWTIEEADRYMRMVEAMNPGFKRPPVQ